MRRIVTGTIALILLILLLVAAVRASESTRVMLCDRVNSTVTNIGQIRVECITTDGEPSPTPEPTATAIPPTPTPAPTITPAPTATPPPVVDSVELFGVHELVVTHSAENYANPYNLDEIQIDCTYTAPDGSVTPFWGFYDGDDTFKCRWMPDSVGVWYVDWSMSDGTAGGSQSFTVVDNGLQRGTLQRDGMFFEDGRGNDLDMCGLGMIVFEPQEGYADTYDYVAAQSAEIASDGFSLIQVSGLKPLSPYNTRQLNPAHWQPYENMLRELQEHGIYSFHFRYLNQEQLLSISDADLHHWQRTRIARLGAFWSDVGVTPTWEWPEIVSPDRVAQIQAQYAALDPFPRLLTAHDGTPSSFASWLGFASTQAGKNNPFVNHSRTAGLGGGVAPEMTSWPIVGSEGLWYQSPFAYQPQTETEMRQGVYNDLLAGVIPVVSSWHWELQQPLPDAILTQYKIACKFVHEGDYRSYEIRNDLQRDNAQIVSGNDGEFLAYTIDGNVKLPLGAYNLTWLDSVHGSVTAYRRTSIGDAFACPYGDECALRAVITTKEGLEESNSAEIPLPATIDPHQ